MQNQNFKKLAIIGGVLAAILAAVLGFLFVSSSRNDLEIKNTQVIPTLNPQAESSYESFFQDNVSFKYPKDTEVKTAPIAGGGDSVTVDTDPGIADSPKIQIQITPKDADTFKNMNAIFTQMGYEKSDILMGEGSVIQAILYKGQLSLRSVPMRESAAIFEHADSVYKIQLTYISHIEDQKAEKVFMDVLSTFKP